MNFKLLYESFAVQRDIENLATATLKFQANFYKQAGAVNSLGVGTHSDIFLMDGMDFDDIVKYSKFKPKTPELKGFIKSNFLDDIHFATTDGNTPLGVYHHGFRTKRIKLNYFKDDLKYSKLGIKIEKFHEVEEIFDWTATETIEASQPKITIPKGDTLTVKYMRMAKDGVMLQLAKPYKNEIAVWLSDEDASEFSRKSTGNTEKADLEKSISEADILDMLKLRYTTLVHELTHAMDDYVSEGHALEKRAEHQLGSEEGFDDYLRLPHEINARYTQTVSRDDMMEIKMYPSKPTRKKESGGFEEYADYFKKLYPGWDVISEKDRKHLLKRLYTDYMTLTKEQETAMVQDALSSVFWDLSLDGRTNYKEQEKLEPRIKNDLKKLSAQFIKSYISGSFKDNTIMRNGYSGMVRSLYDMYQQADQKIIDKVHKEFKLSANDQETLKKKALAVGKKWGFELF